MGHYPNATRKCVQVLLGLFSAWSDGTAHEADQESNLERLLNTAVKVAARRETQVSTAPGIITVLQREEIEGSGARTLSELLERVPGLFGLHDYLGTDIGVRGYMGGAREYGRILKVMIDGQSTAFRSSGENHVGLELIPLTAVQRVEILRGPASAVYGADAYMGVVNVVTTQEGSPISASLRAGWHGSNPGRSLEFRLGGGSNETGWMVAGGMGAWDRSGLVLPESSPLLGLTPPRDMVSRNDEDRSRSVFTRAWHQRGPLTLDFSAQVGRLDAHAEWLDFGTLTHENRVVQDQGFARLKAGWQFEGGLNLVGSVGVSKGQPSRNEHLSTGLVTTYPRRALGFKVSELGLEAQLATRSGTLWVLGIDHVSDREQLIDVYSVSRSTGLETLPSPSSGNMTFTNRGIFAQFTQEISSDLSLTLNLRRDEHNRYGNSWSGRGGLSWRPLWQHTFKLVTGNAFKAPVALQLYGKPLYPGELIGNEALEPERARMVELQWYFLSKGAWSWTLTAYGGTVDQSMVLVPYQTGQRTENQGRKRMKGLEGEIRWERSTWSASWTGSLHRATDVTQRVLVGRIETPTERFPLFTSQFKIHKSFGSAGAFEVSAFSVGARRASSSNMLRNFNRAYALGGYTLLEGSYTLPVAKGSVQLAVQNLLDRKTTEPGFRGVDLPGRPREITLTWSMRF